MKNILIFAFAIALGFGTVGESRAQFIDTVVNFSGQTALIYDPASGLDFFNGVELTLGPGTYEFTPVTSSTFSGAIYDGAYSFGNGFWSGGYNVAINDKFHITPYYAPDQAQLTAALAFSKAFGGSFTLTETSNVFFGVSDTIYFDNGGGISLHLVGGIAPVPEPETYGMMMAGLGLLGFFASRRKKNA